LKKSLADYRDRSLQDTDQGLPPWLEGLQLQASGVKAFRILVCGKTGVGKSTLINKVFGVELVCL
jgi:predicted GTPase